MTVFLHTIAHVSRSNMGFVLATLKVIFYGCFVYCHASSRLSPARIDKILNAVPADIRTVLSELNIEPDFTRYASCPRCRATYAPDPDNPARPYPRRCTFQETDKPPCNKKLIFRQVHAPSNPRQSERVTYNPIRPYPYRPINSWLAEMFQRPHLARLVKDAWKPAGTGTTSKSIWADIWDAPVLRRFLGPDGRTPFSDQPENAAHLVFSLFIDWFNPFGNKAAGKSHSIGAIYLVCLNLPPDIRYRPENVYLAGIIPGPNEPELHQLNQFLRPLIDDLLVLWHRGLYLSHTALGSGSLLVRAAVIPLVCDLPALRKAAGFAGHSSTHFCSFCKLLKPDINNLDRPSWRRYTLEQHLKYAGKWKKAPTEAERDRLFKKYGLRWSELLRLPYWDPTKFALVDSMHNLFLGELRHHCRDVWGINVKDKSSDSPKLAPHDPDEQQVWLDRVASYVRRGSQARLSKIRKGYIAAVAELNDAMPTASKFAKKDYIASLLQWVRVPWLDLSVNVYLHDRIQQWTTSPGEIRLPPVLAEPTTEFRLIRDQYDISRFSILDQETVTSLRADIAATSFPSWLERPPRNFGSTSHGKLKADMWRTVCTVSMVITLVRLWGGREATERQRALLENFVHLVSAVDLAARRSTNQERIDKYDRHMLDYLT